MKPHGNSGQIRSHIWVSGPDPIRHLRHIQWHRQRAQAVFRNEPWRLSFDEWLEIWGDRIDCRGRSHDDLCMTRIREDGAWSPNNVVIITRREQFRTRNHTSRYARYPRDERPGNDHKD